MNLYVQIDFDIDMLTYMLQVFQPLLMQHFTVEELKQIKAKVIEQHFKIEGDESQEKFVHDNKSCEFEPTALCHIKTAWIRMRCRLTLRLFQI